MYYFGKTVNSNAEGTQRSSTSGWRWLAMRLDHAPALKEISRFRRTDWSILENVGFT